MSSAAAARTEARAESCLDLADREPFDQPHPSYLCPLLHVDHPLLLAPIARSGEGQNPAGRRRPCAEVGQFSTGAGGPVFRRRLQHLRDPSLDLLPLASAGERHGLEMIRPRERRGPKMANRLPSMVEDRILSFSIAHSRSGPAGVACELGREKDPLRRRLRGTQGGEMRRGCH